ELYVIHEITNVPVEISILRGVNVFPACWGNRPRCGRQSECVWVECGRFVPRIFDVDSWGLNLKPQMQPSLEIFSPRRRILLETPILEVCFRATRWNADRDFAGLERL